MGSNDFSLFIIVLLMSGNRIIAASEYDFDVFPVDKCPVSKEERDKRSNQRECNSTHGYICVSNKHFTSLIEFCSPQGARIRFEKGNCPVLAARGTLNQFNCSRNFSHGCPETNFYSEELYKWPMCTAINTELKCFNADVGCLYPRLQEQHDTTKRNATIIIIVSVLTSIFLQCVVLGIAVYLWKTRRMCFKKPSREDLDESEQLLPMTETIAATKTRKDKDQTN
uniref:Uncharacterized protein LOC111109644 n=1 Tax=Crassostrea virginica TaxID=6565 RepID=A0A8B8BET6_CRAVI|nr:uncharacterized protein LOC111109644 [Crassostrea virginica]